MKYNRKIKNRNVTTEKAEKWNGKPQKVKKEKQQKENERK